MISCEIVATIKSNLIQFYNFLFKLKSSIVINKYWVIVHFYGVIAKCMSPFFRRRLTDRHWCRKRTWCIVT